MYVHNSAGLQPSSPGPGREPDGHQHRAGHHPRAEPEKASESSWTQVCSFSSAGLGRGLGRDMGMMGRGARGGEG